MTTPFEELEIPNVLRSQMKQAKDLGTHAGEESWEAFIRVLRTVPSDDPMVLTLTFMVGAMNLLASVTAITKIVCEQEPVLAPIFVAHIKGFFDANS